MSGKVADGELLISIQEDPIHVQDGFTVLRKLKSTANPELLPIPYVVKKDLSRVDPDSYHHWIFLLEIVSESHVFTKRPPVPDDLNIYWSEEI